MCRLCNERPVNPSIIDPKCAFDKNGWLRYNKCKDAEIQKDIENYYCGTLLALRSVAYVLDEVIYSDDEQATTLYDSCGNFIFLQWYKSRNAFSHIYIARNNEPQHLPQKYCNYNHIEDLPDELYCLSILKYQQYKAGV